MYNLKNVKTPMEDTACYFAKTITPPWLFLCFLNCTNSNEPRKTSQIRKMAKWRSSYLRLSLMYWLLCLLFILSKYFPCNEGPLLFKAKIEAMPFRHWALIERKIDIEKISGRILNSYIRSIYLLCPGS